MFHTQAPEVELLPAELQPFIVLTEVDHVRLTAAPLFERCFGSSAPTFPHHMVAFYRSADASLRVLSYGHLWIHAGMGLSGGACTDGNVIRSMPEHHRAALTRHGGARRWVLSYTLQRFSSVCEAFFSYSGNARARDICMQLGFEPMEHPYLLSRWPISIDSARRLELEQQIVALGPF